MDYQAGFYSLGDEVSTNGLATEFCATGKVNTESYQRGSNATITGRLLFVHMHKDGESDDSEDDLVQEHNIVGDRVAVVA